MSSPSEPAGPAEEHYQAASLIVTPRADELGFALRKDEFETLCDGETSDSRAGRDLYLGMFFGAVVGLVGLVATTDWDAVLHQERKGPLVLVAILIALAAGPGVGAIVQQRRYTRTRNDSPYARLRKRISQYFENPVARSAGASRDTFDKRQMADLRAQTEKLSQFQKMAIEELILKGGMTGAQFAQLVKDQGFPVDPQAAEAVLTQIGQVTTFLGRDYTTGSYFVKPEVKEQLKRIMRWPE